MDVGSCPVWNYSLIYKLLILAKRPRAWVVPVQFNVTLTEWGSVVNFGAQVPTVHLLCFGFAT